jgi:hypothetical protein
VHARFTNIRYYPSNTAVAKAELELMAEGGDMSASIDKLHDKARRAIESGENKFRDAAECLAEAQKLGATQRQSAKGIGKSPAWVNALLKWRSSGYKAHCPFPHSKRRVQPAEQKATSRPPTNAELAQARTAKANADRAKAEAQRAKAEAAKAQAEFQKARAETYAKMFSAGTKSIPNKSRELLIKALRMLGSERAAERASAAIIVENQRARLNLTWDDLIVPPEIESEMSDAA